MEPPSKSQRKREATVLQEIAVALCSLSVKQLKLIAMPEKLFAAILEYKKLNSNRAVHRQAKFLGKLMREIDLEVLQRTFSKIPNLPNLPNLDFIKL